MAGKPGEEGLAVCKRAAKKMVSVVYQISDNSLMIRQMTCENNDKKAGHSLVFNTIRQCMIKAI